MILRWPRWSICHTSVKPSIKVIALVLIILCDAVHVGRGWWPDQTRLAPLRWDISPSPSHSLLKGSLMSMDHISLHDCTIEGPFGQCVHFGQGMGNATVYRDDRLDATQGNQWWLNQTRIVNFPCHLACSGLLTLFMTSIASICFFDQGKPKASGEDALLRDHRGYLSLHIVSWYY